MSIRSLESAIPPPTERNHGFNTTQWSLVLEAGRGGRSIHSADALERLCHDYWPPIYACVCASGRNRAEAEDITQDFFASLLRYDSFSKVDRGKGRFRSFLRVALKHFLSNRWHRERARKRGGGLPVISLDAVPGLEREALEHGNGMTPDRAFDRSWAQTLLARVMDRLRHEYESGGQGPRFAVLKVYLLAGTSAVPYADTAGPLGLSIPAVKSAIYKLRSRYRDMLRAEIAQTVTDPADIDDEIRHLVRAVIS